MGEKRIAPFAGYADILRAQGATDSFLGKGSGMHGVVQEPGPVVVPQVMVWILRADADSREVSDGVHDA